MDELSKYAVMETDGFLEKQFIAHGYTVEQLRTTDNLCVSQEYTNHYFVNNKYIFSITHEQKLIKEEFSTKIVIDLKSYYDAAMEHYLK
jgi:hypothetical protein